MRKQIVSMTLALVIGAAAPAAAQIRQGDHAYIEGDDGSLALYRRLDRPDEGDNRARFQLVSDAEQQTFVRTHGPATVPVIDRTAVISRTGGAVAVAEAPSAQVVQTETLTSEQIQVVAPEPEPPLVRPRFGLSALGGGTVAVGENLFEDPEGWMGGIALRLGIQIGDWFSVYYQPTGLVAALETTYLGESYDEAFTLWNSLLVDFTVFDFVSLGAGPSVDFYWECEPGSQGQQGCAAEEAFFGLHGRVAVNLGGAFMQQRGAVSLSFDIHPTWFNDESETLSMLGGLGIELY